MSVPSPRSVRRTRGTLAMLAGATLWAALGGATPAHALAVMEITSLSATPSPVLAGNNLTFAVTVENNGAASPADDATNVSLTLDVSSGILLYQSETITGATCSATATLLTCNFGSMAAGSAKSGNIVFQVAASTPDQNLTSTFSVVSTEDTTADTEAEITDIDVEADLVVDKKVPSPTNEAVPGQNVVYTVDVQNNGPSDATSVALTDVGPAGFGSPTFSGGAGCIGATCNLGTILPGAANKKTVTVTFTIPDNYHVLNGTADVTNTANATTATPDGGGSDLSDSVTTPIVPKVNLSVVLSSAATSVTPGTAGSYVITVSKSGPSRLERLHVTGALSLLGAVFTPSEGIFSATSISPNWIGLDLAGTDSATLTFNGWVSPAQPGASLAASATITVPAPYVDTSAGNDTDAESDTISRLSDLSILKTNNLSGLIPGQAVPYTITVANHGPSDITAASVADNFDATRVSTVSWSCSTARSITDLGQLADGAGGVDGLDGASAVAATLDGQHVYAAASADNSVALFVRNATTGQLTYGDIYADGTDASAIAGASAIAVSPDGGQVYVTGFADNGLEVFTRTALTGALVSLEVEVEGTAGVTGMSGPRGIAVAPDGRHVYVAAATGSAVVVFTRNLTTGALTWSSTLTNASPGVSGIGGARAVAVTPDGRHVVVAGETDSGVAVFTRNLTTGALTFAEAKINGIGGVSGIGGASALAF
ncbi:MAG: trimeric autotransporter adhesin, partial [Acidobacteriota bacterium]|nr:trimeric autotransporter adhesin [Acidobacteriota bacterium]